MNIVIVGSGYVGLVCGAGFAEMGNAVICVDTDANKIGLLQQGQSPIYEPGLEDMVRNNLDAGTLSFTTDMAGALKKATVCFIAVGTPMGEDGSADLTHVLEVADQIGRHMIHPMFIVNKSTVPVGTADQVRSVIAERLQERGSEVAFSVISNPEFLKEGAAIADFMKPDRIIIGANAPEDFELMKELYAPFNINHDKLMPMDVKSAEMTKYAANAMLATKISFINEIANICELVGADVNQVREGIGSDRRIGYDFIYPGCGYGGSCFPKDVQALMKTAQDCGYEPQLIKSVERVNQNQKKMLAEKVIRRFGQSLDGFIFAVWGLAFKPGTDDMREAPAITIIKHLTSRGASIRAYDPKASDMAKQYYFQGDPALSYFKSKYAALNQVDALILATEWKEFRSPDFDEMKKLMKRAVIFDGRNQYDRKKMSSLGFEYHQIGWADEANAPVANNA